MKRLALTMLAAVVFWTSKAQETPAAALSLTPGNYITQTGTGVGPTMLSANLGSTPSGVAACVGAANDDRWYVFNAETQALKVEVNTTAFDAVIEILEVGSLISVACQNTNGANSGELLQVNNLTIGNDYLLRIYSLEGVGGAFTFYAQHYPTANVRDGWHPVPGTDIGLPGYRINEGINRSQYTPYNGLIQNTEWLFIDTDNGDEYTLLVNGSNGIVNLNSVGGLCFGKNYDVYVQVRVDDFWCGFGEVRSVMTEAVPTTEMEPGYAGGSYDLNQDVKARFVGNGQIIEWRLTTDNGNTVLTHQGAASTSYCYFDLVECIRYNKIYTIEARAFYCGVWGPWSDPDFIIINPLPYVNLRPQYCNTVQFPGATLMCEFIPVADTYGWQFAPVDPDDPSLTPIGPAIVTYSVNTTSLYLLPLGLQFGTTYRVGTKPFLGTTDNCDDPQEGDYGFFCPVSIGNPNALMPGPEYRNEAPNEPSLAIDEAASFSVFPNPVREGIANVKLEGLGLSGRATLQLYDLQGKLLLSEQLMKLEEAHFLQVGLPAGCTSGTYLLVLENDQQRFSTRVLVQ